MSNTGEGRICMWCDHAIWPDPERPRKWTASDGSWYCHEFSVVGGPCPPDHAPKERKR